MIKLGGLVFGRGFIREGEDDKYTHIGYGNYKKTSEKDKEGAQTYKKDDTGKYIPTGDDANASGAGKEAKPKANIFDKPKGKSSTAQPEKPKANGKSAATAAPKEKGTVPSTKLTSIMPKASKDAFDGNSDINKISDKTKKQISMKIDELDKMAQQAQKMGKNAPDFNLCEITIPGTNLYCDDNLGIPRDQMPQFKGKPLPNTPASKMPLDKWGGVDTEPMFKKMLAKKGIKIINTVIPSDSLKATQSELIGTKVAGITKAIEADPTNPKLTAPIYVSRDGYVIDGHHRWAAMTSKAIRDGKPANMKVMVIDDDAKNIIPMANKFAQDIGIAAQAGKVEPDAGKQPESNPTKTDSAPKGNPKVNKTVKSAAEKLGITPDKMDSDEYETAMIKAAVAALTDANDHSGARKLIAKVSNEPEFEKDPAQMKPKNIEFGTPEYKQWVRRTVWGSDYYKTTPETNKLGTLASKSSDYDYEDALSSIAYTLKMNGFGKLAQTMSSIHEGRKKQTKMVNILTEGMNPISQIANLTGARPTAIQHFIESFKLNAEKIADYLKKGGLRSRMDFTSAIAGVPDNKFEKMFKQKFANESILKEDRSLSQIAREISQDWKNVNYGAKPYLSAMYSLNKISDKYMYDSGTSVVAYFLANAGSWKGEKAKEIKAELNKMLKSAR